MSYTFTCDWCGERIESGEVVELRARAGDHSDWKGGWVAHYHGAGEDSCYAHIRDAIDLIRKTGPSIEAIPVLPTEPASPQRCRASVPGKSPTHGIRLDGIKLHPGAAFALQDAGIRTLEDAAEFSEIELIAIDRVGQTTIHSLIRGLEAKGLSLRAGPSPDELGLRIRGLREDAALTRDEVARVLDPEPDRWGRFKLNNAAIAAWEGGRRAPTHEQLERLASFFGVSVDHLTEAEAVHH